MRARQARLGRGRWSWASAWMLVGLVMVALVLLAGPAGAAGPDPSKVGDLAGNLPLGVFLLVPLALGAAFVTAVALAAPVGPSASRRRGGVTKALDRSAGTDDEPSS